MQAILSRLKWIIYSLHGFIHRIPRIYLFYMERFYSVIGGTVNFRGLSQKLIYFIIMLILISMYWKS